MAESVTARFTLPQDPLPTLDSTRLLARAALRRAVPGAAVLK